MKFEELGLHPQIVDALSQLKISECTEIQKSTIPLILDGKDISGLSQTGTGKTFAFAIPLLERLLRTRENPAAIAAGAAEAEKNKDAPRNLNPNPPASAEAHLSTDALSVAGAAAAAAQVGAEHPPHRGFDSWNSGNFILVLVPTRELADQINKSILSICAGSEIKTAVIYGGVEYDSQIQKIKDGVDFVVGTPGRLIDLYKNHLINFRLLKAIVFDEADRMFDMGFKDDMVYILQRAPQDRQIALFSATLNFDVMNTIYQFGANPVEINISRDQVKAGEVIDELFHVGERDKPQYLLSLITRTKPKQTIIFSNFKNNVDRITRFLNSNNIPAVGISSLLTQSQRERVLEQFKNDNERNTLVATDVAARGLDVKGVDLIVNYDLPDDAENYVHRIGRTGRAGAKGQAFSLVSDRDVMALSRIEGYLKNKVNIGWLEDADLIKDFKPLPYDEFRGESRVKKTGLAAMKAQIPNGSRPPREGSRDRNDRPPRDERPRDDRPRRPQGDRPAGERSQEARPPRDNNRSPNGAVQHRDRAMGRHQNINGAAKPAANGATGSTTAPAARPQHNQNRNRNESQNRNQPQAGKSTYKAQPQQQHTKSFRAQKGKNTSYKKATPNVSSAPKKSGKLSTSLKKFVRSLFSSDTEED